MSMLYFHFWTKSTGAGVGAKLPSAEESILPRVPLLVLTEVQGCSCSGGTQRLLRDSIRQCQISTDAYSARSDRAVEYDVGSRRRYRYPQIWLPGCGHSLPQDDLPSEQGAKLELVLESWNVGL